MDKTIEISIRSADGEIDCMLEPHRPDDGALFYSATILYPEMVNGYGRSEIFFHDMHPVASGRGYAFDANEDIHPKVRKLEKEISDGILAGGK